MNKKRFWLMILFLFFLGISENDLLAEAAEFAQLGYLESAEGGYLTERWTDRDGNEIEAEKTEKKGMCAFSEQSLPDSYDLRKTNRVTSAKTQGNAGACWAFAALGSLESYGMTQKYFGQEPDFAEAHLIWFAGKSQSLEEKESLYGDGLNFEDPYREGGNWLMAVSMLSRYCGTAEETKFPFYPEETGRMGNYSLEEKYQCSLHLTEANVLDHSDRGSMKREIMEKGALMSGYYNNTAYYQMVASMGSMCYYYAPAQNGTIPSATHAVLLCGWDDHFSKENFKEGARPNQDGAWLVKNSWGTSWGDEGYFWISYEEPTFDRTVSFTGEIPQKQKTIYEYDGMAYGGSFLIENGEEYSIANVYQAENKEKLTEISFYTMSAGMNYRIEIYQNDETGMPGSGTCLLSQEGEIPWMGYHTVTLRETIEIEKEKNFSVVITYYRTDGEDYRIPIEYSGKTNPISYGGKKGQSFCKGNGAHDTWKDAMEEYPGCYNFCIKAFSISEVSDSREEDPEKEQNNEEQKKEETEEEQNKENSEKEETIKQEESKNPLKKMEITNLYSLKLTLGKKETFRLRIKLTPSNTSDKIKFSSSKKTVVSVSSTGKITAKAVGTAKIYMKNANKILKTITVNVKKAPGKITLSAASKTLKKKKTYNIKVIFPKNSYSKKRTYLSSNKKVAIVSTTGKVTAKKRGTAKITVKTFNGKKAVLKIRVI